MKLADYINSKPCRVTAKRDLARSVGVSPKTVTSWLNGHRHPGRSKFVSIYKATNGAVSVTDLIE